MVFSNLECCLVETPAGHSVSNEGFFADPTVGGEALKLAGIHAVGIANNVHYGEANIEARSRASISSAFRMPAPAPTSPRRVRRSSSSATAFASVSCSAARSTGRPITRRARTRLASPSFAATPPITCRCSRRASTCRPPTGPAFRPRSSPGPTRPISAHSRRTSRRCALASTCWWRRAIGGWARTCCNT